jgi:hypothetical protein
MEGGWAPLLVAVLAMVLLRGTGLAVAWRLRPGHPLIGWAAAVSEAALAAWVVLAVILPGVWPVAARASGLAVAMAVFLLARQRLLPAMAAGLAATWGIASFLGG